MYAYAQKAKKKKKLRLEPTVYVFPIQRANQPSHEFNKYLSLITVFSMCSTNAVFIQR